MKNSLFLLTSSKNYTKACSCEIYAKSILVLNVCLRDYPFLIHKYRADATVEKNTLKRKI